MKVEKVYNLCFSPTGGTEKVLELVSKPFGKSEDIDLSVFKADYSRFHFEKDDICILAVPSYGGRVPQPVIDNLSQISADGTPVVLVAVYGNRAYDDTLLELKYAAEDVGFICVGAVTAVAEHSLARQYGAGRPDEEDAAELISFGERIKEKLKKTESPESIPVPGNTPYQEFDGVPVKPRGSLKCTKCGNCVRRCPVGAIPLKDPRITKKSKCISCMRCVEVCPVQARSINSVLTAMIGKKLRKNCKTRKENEVFL